MGKFLDEKVSDLKEVTKDGGSIICGLSGGVDSFVAAGLLTVAIGTQVKCILVDNGLLRDGEVEWVRHMCAKHLKQNLTVIDARDRFLTALTGVTDPEIKRKIIGHEFIKVFECFVNDYEKEYGCKIRFLVQGTLASDCIESGINELA